MSGLRVLPGRLGPVAAALGALLVGAAAFAPPVHAETIRQREWYLDRMQASAMWKVSTGKGITVALVDTGVNEAVPELKGKVLPGKDFTPASGGSLDDKDGHGTSMATLITGNGVGGNGVQGLAPGARVLSVRVASQTDKTQRLGEAIRYAADSQAKIINISLGGGLGREKLSDLQDAVDYTLAKGKLIFAGSGNSGDEGNAPQYPASLPGVVAVSATDKNNSVTKFSNYGPQIALAAPGKDIPGRCLHHTGYCSTDGTSQATALASASAALIWAKHPGWTNNQVLRVLINTAGKPTTGKVPSKYIGYGIVRPRVALLDSPGDPGPADINPLTKKNTSATATPAASSSAEPSATEKRSRTSAAADDGGGGNTGLWVGIGAAALVVLAAVVTVLVRRRPQPWNR